MKAIFGVISLLVALAVVGVLASRQLKTANIATPSLAGVSASAALAAGVVLPAASAGTPAEQSKQIQQQVMTDVMKAIQQGADADADKKEPQ